MNGAHWQRVGLGTLHRSPPGGHRCLLPWLGFSLLTFILFDNFIVFLSLGRVFDLLAFVWLDNLFSFFKCLLSSSLVNFHTAAIAPPPSLMTFHLVSMHLCIACDFRFYLSHRVLPLCHVSITSLLLFIRLSFRVLAGLCSSWSWRSPCSCVFNLVAVTPAIAQMVFLPN